MARIEELESRLRALRQLSGVARRKEPGWDLKVMSGAIKILYPGKHSIRRFLDDRIDETAAELNAAREAEAPPQEKKHGRRG